MSQTLYDPTNENSQEHLQGGVSPVSSSEGLPVAKPLIQGRTRHLHVNISDDENEFIARKAADLGESANVFARKKIFGNGWKKELEKLRAAQKNCSLSELDVRRK